jgi:hypothetical protein
MSLVSRIANKIIKSKQPNKSTRELTSLYKQPRTERNEEVPTFSIYVEGYAHQCDLLFLPTDRGFKYALVVVDCFSKECDAVPLKSKDADVVLKAIVKIYGRHILSYPKVLECDSGTEFKSAFKKHFIDKGVKVHVGQVGRHRTQALVEMKNKYIGSIIHRIQAQAEIDTGRANRKWIEYLPTIIEEINNDLPEPKSTQENDFPIISNSNKKLLGIGKMVRTLLEYPQDVNGKRLGGKFRSSDIRWSREEYAITEVLLKPDAPPMYITTKDNVARTRGQLQVL